MDLSLNLCVSRKEIKGATKRRKDGHSSDGREGRECGEGRRSVIVDSFPHGGKKGRKDLGSLRLCNRVSLSMLGEGERGGGRCISGAKGWS